MDKGQGGRGIRQLQTSRCFACSRTDGPVSDMYLNSAEGGGRSMAGSWGGGGGGGAEGGREKEEEEDFDFPVGKRFFSLSHL